MAYDLDYPKSRTEKILMNILEKITDGGGSSDNTTALEIRDSIGYKAFAETSDKTYILYEENLPDIDPEAGGLVSFDIDVYFVLADNITSMFHPEDKNIRHFYDIYSVYEANYKNPALYIKNDNTSSKIFDSEIAQGFKTEIQQVDPNCNFYAGIETGFGGFQHTHPFENFEDYMLYFRFYILGSRMNPTVYNQLRPVIAELFDSFTNATHVYFEYEANEDYAYSLEPKNTEDL